MYSTKLQIAVKYWQKKYQVTQAQIQIKYGLTSKQKLVKIN